MTYTAEEQSEFERVYRAGKRQNARVTFLLMMLLLASQYFREEFESFFAGTPAGVGAVAVALFTLTIFAISMTKAHKCPACRSSLMHHLRPQSCDMCGLNLR